MDNEHEIHNRNIIYTCMYVTVCMYMCTYHGIKRSLGSIQVHTRMCTYVPECHRKEKLLACSQGQLSSYSF